jgi:hypothetical protein
MLVVANAFGSTTSAVQVITVSSGPPLFLSQNITNATRAIGGRVTYSVVAGGSAPVSYQWNLNSTPIRGATNSVLMLRNLQLADQGAYTVTLSNPYGLNSNSMTGVVSVVTVTNLPFAAMYGNPLAYYRLNETSGTTATDIAGGFNGTLNGSIVEGVPGPQPPTWVGFESTNTAFQFDGTSARVQLPPFNLTTTNLTFATWINPAGPQLDQAGILVSRNGNELGGLFLNYVNNGTPNNMLGFVWAGTGSYTHDSGLIPVVGQWNFVAFVMEPQRGTLYLDTGDGTGLQSWIYPMTGSDIPQLVAFSSGNIGDDAPYGRFFNGSIDEVVVYDRSLSPAEIANLVLLGSDGPTSPQIAREPISQTVNPGHPATFSVEAFGALPLAYQWFHASTNLPGATSATLTIPSVHSTDLGSYYVAITNSLGSSNSFTVTLTLLTPTNYSTAVLYGNPLAYYRLDETNGTQAADIASGLDGTILGSMVLGVPGPQPPTWAGLESNNTAFQFDGSTTRVQLPSFDLQTNLMTIVAWINPNGAQNDQTGILVSRTDNNLGGFIINYNNSQALSYVWEGTTSYSDFQSGLQPTWNAWNFAALVIDPTKGTVYLDKGDGAGLLSASFYPPQGNKTVTWDSPNIGVDTYGNRWFNGSIDEVAVYDRALSPAEIADLDLLGSTAGPVAPRITQQPTSQAVYAGNSASFSVGAIGTPPLAYQWYHAGTNLAGATTSVLSLPSVYYTDAGSYYVAITNGVGSSNSVPVMLNVLAPPTFANLTNGLVLHLTFDENYQDSSGRGNNATPVGSPTFVAGKLGQAMHYNTDNSNPNNVIYNYATLGNPSDLQFGTSQNFSVSYWIRFTGASVDLPVLCNNDCGEGCIGFFFGPAYYTSGAWAWSFANTSYKGIDADGAANSINDGQWHNVVNTFDRSGLGLTYLDGIPVDSRPVNTFTDSLDTGNPVNVGQVGTAAYAVVFGADVDDLGVWLRPLTPTEAESIYMVGQQGRSFDTYGPVRLSLTQAGNNLQLVWQTGTLLSSTNGVNGTYNPVPGASAPYYHVTPGPGSTFYRVRY